MPRIHQQTPFPAGALNRYPEKVKCWGLTGSGDQEETVGSPAATHTPVPHSSPPPNPHRPHVFPRSCRLRQAQRCHLAAASPELGGAVCTDLGGCARLCLGKQRRSLS